ncbi:hypothetical protein LHV18_01135 [Providencia rettgeri]|uniref:hypothetical protein n=1 Tax=Providencia TaxID=586 RepID=UPI001CFEB1BB|nr:hypothetical protein [Providencia rettgeri]EIU7556864.1 hypothetical protein [Providencia rettgeri]MCB4839239.1 hypothetical protein [Providencia rettgeri]HEM8305111.1 hypothetical protein [Providencia rettgeri]
MRINLFMLVAIVTSTPTPSYATESEVISLPFYSHCLDMDEDLVFNGSKNYLCEFEGIGIEQIYNKYKSYLYHQELLQNTLPKKDMLYETENVEVIYKWLPPNKLRLTVTYDNGTEQYIYYFIKKKNSTTVFHQINTGY